MLDELQNEGQEKLGKFAVVRWNITVKKYLQYQME
jgi:hypothetical protein